jgi:hypothetical protein
MKVMKERYRSFITLRKEKFDSKLRVLARYSFQAQIANTFLHL